MQEAVVFNKAMSYIVEALGKVGKPGMAQKNEQRMAIPHVYNGKDMFVCLPRRQIHTRSPLL